MAPPMDESCNKMNKSSALLQHRLYITYAIGLNVGYRSHSVHCHSPQTQLIIFSTCYANSE